jgi:DNA-binding transcriptional ArsR family regulator
MVSITHKQNAYVVRNFNDWLFHHFLIYHNDV